MPDADRTGVVLLQMGGPAEPSTLAPFLRRLFCDPMMIQLPGWLSPFQPILGRAYGTLRAREVREEYEQIGWSAINETTRSLAGAVEDRLDHVVGVRAGMRYTEPRADEAVRELADAGADRLLGVTLYPFYSDATTGSSVADLERASREHPADLPVDSVDRWGLDEAFLDLQAEWTRETIEQADPSEERAILLSAHGLPQAYVDQGDPYRQEVQEAADRLAKRLPGERVELAFQSDVGPVEWLRPYTQDKIRELADEGVSELVVVPFGFVSEHIETLYEIDDEYREVALEAGIEAYHRVPAFDDAPAFADVIANLVAPRLEVPP